MGLSWLLKIVFVCLLGVAPAATLALADNLTGPCQGALVSAFGSMEGEDESSLSGLLNHLLDKGVLSIAEIESWFEDLKRRRPHHTGSTEKAMSLKVIERNLEEKDFSHFATLLREMRDLLEDQTIVRRHRESETASSTRQAQFLKFNVPRDELHPPSSLVAKRIQLHSDEFEIMDMPFTAWMWRTLEGAKLPEDISEDQPVHDVTAIDIDHLIEKIHRNQLPVDLVRRVIPDHRPGDFYQLPTLDIYLWLLQTWQQQARQANTYLGRKKDILAFAWLEENSGGVVHDVSERKGFNVHSKRIYDLLGNIAEIAIIDDNSGFWIGMHFGGDFSTKEKDLGQNSRNVTDPDDLRYMRHSRGTRFPRLGFRLMRRTRGGPL